VWAREPVVSDGQVECGEHQCVTGGILGNSPTLLVVEECGGGFNQLKSGRSLLPLELAFGV
jgi:hypothetical protein